MASYYGSPCRGNCSGHRAGARYVRRGGRTTTRRSPSFNNGMRIAQRQLRNQGITVRLRKP